MLSLWGSGQIKDSNKKELDDLKQKWEIVKASKEDEARKRNEECEFDYLTKCSEMDAKIEWLVYANEHGSTPANDKFNLRMKRDCNRFFKSTESDISEAYGELEEKGLLKRYNNFKKKKWQSVNCQVKYALRNRI